MTHVDGHFVERQHGRIGLLGVGREQHAGVAEQRRQRSGEREQGSFHFSKRPPGTRTSPLSVPMYTTSALDGDRGDIHGWKSAGDPAPSSR